ncbi:MAG: hypothetical protein SGI83_15975 [Bacteroidota bacterium]|nr:hypothetical protein [Bacteroidota bacterium]
MKKISFILLLIFTATITGPAISSVIKESKVSIFAQDEEKNERNAKTEEVENEEYHLSNFCYAIRNNLYISALSAIEMNPKLIASFSGVITPPPDHC